MSIFTSAKSPKTNTYLPFWPTSLLFFMRSLFVIIWSYGSIINLLFLIWLACESAAPAAPSGSTSDYDGTSKPAGSIVTYTCSAGKKLYAIVSCCDTIIQKIF